MSPTLKVGLVVQGPLISRGRRGSSIRVAHKDLTPSDIVDFNCINTIAENLSRVGRGIPVANVVWDDEDDRSLNELRQVVGSAEIVLIQDCTQPIPARDGLVPANNKYRQILGVLRGCEVLSEHGCTLVAKVRSDQSIDVARLLAETEILCREGFDMILPYFDRQGPKRISDFYFGGRLEFVAEFCSTFLSSPEKARSVHGDLYCHLEATAQLRAASLTGTRSRARLLRYRGWEGVGIYSRQLFESTSWRGELIESHPEMRFSTEVFGGSGIGRLDFLRSTLWDPLRAVAYRVRNAYRCRLGRSKAR